MDRPITRKMLIDWAGARVVSEAEAMVDRGMVLEASWEPPFIAGSVLWSNRPLRTALKLLPDGTVESHCPCRANTERGLICSHVIALGSALVQRGSDPLREAKYQEEMRRASRLAAINEKDYIQRVPEGTPGALPAKLILTLAEDWQDTFPRGTVGMRCEVQYRSEKLPVDEVPTNIPLSFSKDDDNLLFVLEDISEGPARSQLALGRFDILNLIRLHTGHKLPVANGSDIAIDQTPMRTNLRMDLDHKSGELILTAHTELPFSKNGDGAFHVVSGRDGWVYGNGHLWPLENILPRPYHPIYDGSVTIARPDVLRFIQKELPVLSRFAQVASDITPDLFTVEPAHPRFRLTVSGSPASLSAVLHADYGVVELIAGKPDAREAFGIPDPDDFMRYLVRNPHAEQDAIKRLASAGFHGETGDTMSSLVGNREVLNFLGSFYPALRRLGWRVELHGRVEPYVESIDFATPVVHITEGSGEDWFEVGFDFEDSQGGELSNAEIQLALRRGDSFVRRGEGMVLIDGDAVRAMQDVFSDCATDDGSRRGVFRMSSIYAPFVKASLDALDGVDVEDSPTWRSQAEKGNRSLTVQDVELPAALAKTLRAYQKEGVNWLRFLETHGFAGILADEMGLGKTVQTLAWLQLQRHLEHARQKPSLIVCPSSLVENWAEEAEKFVPNLKVLLLSGSDRHEAFESLDEADIAITSYALLRRDADELAQREFASVILDEAQHIKNRSTQNALAAKRMRASHRLVLTGTPMENSVSDLWSIMDFLMPGYLGPHRAFKENYESPIMHDGADGNYAQARLRRKLHPFMLRRLKREVARDLPPKIERTAMCTLTPDQKNVYTQLLKTSQQHINDMVAAKGFGGCRMEVLTTLMRLRQVCCHLDLLKMPDLQTSQPSAKLDHFSELLDEALDSGHRMLVFSQFVSMLHIIRDELDAKGLEYCYLDGSTKERMKVVHRFNLERKIPVFLISLKAGGTGLNLTGADMVVHFDPWWNPAVENQATDRAYRIGQKRTVYSIKLITRGTVEEKVLALQQRKKAIIDATIESDEGMVQKLTWEDVQELLTL